MAPHGRERVMPPTITGGKRAGERDDATHLTRAGIGTAFK
jgi:hypothetical protein